MKEGVHVMPLIAQLIEWRTVVDENGLQCKSSLGIVNRFLETAAFSKMMYNKTILFSLIL